MSLPVVIIAFADSRTFSYSKKLSTKFKDGGRRVVSRTQPSSYARNDRPGLRSAHSAIFVQDWNGTKPPPFMVCREADSVESFPSSESG